MGLNITCKGHEDLYISYVGFAIYRIKLLNAYNICKDKALENFILHSNGDGKFSYKECKEIYKSLEQLTPKLEDDWLVEFHLKMIDILKFAYENRRNVFFC